jgi:hypothetical protein
LILWQLPTELEFSLLLVAQKKILLINFHLTSCLLHKLPLEELSIDKVPISTSVF